MIMEKAYKQQDVSVEALNQLIWEHVEARDWHHNPSRSLAISLALEASELLEHYQWGDTAVGGQAAVAEELADVLIYSFQIAQQNNIDIASEIKKKLEKAAIKYPAENFKNKSAVEKKAAWKKSKLSHQKEGL